jgi:hypothetical protein
MPDHYAKAQLAISLGMVSSLFKDLRSGWRPGPKAEPALVPIEDTREQADPGEIDSDHESELGLISSTMISLYKTKSEVGAVIASLRVAASQKAHAPMAEDPQWPACARLRNKGTKIAYMVEIDEFPTSADEICHFCRMARPEILDQFYLN